MSNEEIHERIFKVLNDIVATEQLLYHLKAQHANLITELDDVITPEDTRPYYPAYGDTMRVSVMKAHRKGYSTRQIQMLTGVSKSTVARWVSAQQGTREHEG